MLRGMFVTGPLSAGDLNGDGNQVRVHSAVGRTFDELTGQALNPTLRGYVADMTAPYGIAVHEELIEQGVGHSYGEMCVPLLAELVSEERPADLLVLATGVPDVRLGRATATYLSWHCAGAPLAFAVCDQGLLAAFTALHLIDGYARTGGCRRAVLLVAEQPTLYHELPVPTTVPDRAAAVGVVLETEGSQGALSVRRHTKLAEHHVPDVLAAEVARLSANQSTPTVLLGARLATVTADRRVDGNVLVCRDSQPFTDIWLEFSHRLPGWRESGGQVLLAEYDPTLGYLFSAIVSFGEQPLFLP
jgi:4-hydroxymandelate oxidase